MSVHLPLHDHGIQREESKDIYFVCTRTDSQQNKEEILKTVTVLISVTGHVVIADINNYLLPVFIPYSLCLQQALQLVVIFNWWDDSNLHSGRVWTVHSPAWIGLLGFSIT